jgi:hypothetical protein
MRTAVVLLVLTFSSIVASAAPTPPHPSATMSGTVYGQQNPLGGAHTYLYEPVDATTGTTHSKSLLQLNVGGTPVTEDANGNCYATLATTPAMQAAQSTCTGLVATLRRVGLPLPRIPLQLKLVLWASVQRAD